MTSLRPPISHDGTTVGLNGTLLARYDAVRAHTERLCVPLATEDYVVSSMPDASPTKWHLAHTSWFFETFVLGPHAPAYRPIDARYAFLFNSYYVQAGERHCRAQRGLVTRPTVDEVYAYRAHVDAGMRVLIDSLAGDDAHPVAALIELGLHHEQQHQELLLTDIKHAFWMKPLRPVYSADAPDTRAANADGGWRELGEGIRWIGHDGDGFAYDNESPPHRVFLDSFRLARRLVTNGEFLAFIEDGGYSRPELWLSAGLATVQQSAWSAPIYWERNDDGTFLEFTLSGTRALAGSALEEPLLHVSHYEADAFARWSGARLPSEFEWETAALEARGLGELLGPAWQWTGSAYTGYPNYSAAAGAIGEYNGKWMADQWVLRGASCGTPPLHSRLTYRNFFPSDARWQFTGIRLASAIS